METKASYVVVGAFVFGMVAAVFGFVIWLGNIELASQTNLFRIGFSGSVTGLSVGSPVRYRGIPIGQVTDIRLDPENVERILVMIEVNDKVPIKQDAYAVLESQGLTGVGFIQIQGGSKSATSIQPSPGQTVPEIPARASVFEEVFQSAPEIASQLALLTNRAAAFLGPENHARFKNILANLDTISGALADQADDIRALISNANAASASIRELSAILVPSVVQITGDLDALTEDTAQTLSAIRGTVSGIDGEITALSDGASSALEQIRATADQAEGLISENRGAVHDFSQTGLYELTQFLIEGRILLEHLNRVVRQFERDPSRILFGSRDSGVETSK